MPVAAPALQPGAYAPVLRWFEESSSPERSIPELNNDAPLNYGGTGGWRELAAGAGNNAYLSGDGAGRPRVASPSAYCLSGLPLPTGDRLSL